MLRKYKVPSVNLVLEAAIMFACVGLVVVSVQKGGGRIEVALSAGTFLLFAVILAFTASTKLWIEDGAIVKSSLLGKKSLPLREITEVSHISVRGRFIFLLMTAERMLMISSLPEGFAELRRQMCEQMLEKGAKEFMLPGDNALAAKARNMKILLVVALAVAIAANVYIIYKR
jgi:hypothetical protein